MQIVSLVTNLLGGGSASPTVDRFDTASAASAASAVAVAPSDDLDIAMGTLMAYGGKYLREMALWAYEYGTQTPVESLNNLGSGSSESSSASETQTR